MTDDRPLLLVANSSWNLAHFRGPLIDHLRAAGHGIEVVVPEGEPALPGLVTHHIPLAAAGLSPPAELRSLVALIRLFRARYPAAVLSFTPKGNIYAGLAARATGTPLLPNISGLGTAFLRGGMLLRVQATLYREALRGVPTVFFQNMDDRDLFITRGLIERGQAQLIPGSGIDCDHFRSAPLPSTEAGEARLLFVGRLLGDKGVRELAAAMALLRPRFPGLHLTLLGEAGAANRTAIAPSEVAAWEAQGLLTHAGSAADVRPFIAAADAVVLPSYREGMPRALLEAAAMGRPLLAADVPGCRQLVEDERTGLLFEARSAASLAEAIERFLLSAPARRAAWGQAARAMAEERFDQRLLFAAYEQAVIALRPRSR